MTKLFCAIDTADKDRAISLAMTLNGVAHGIKAGLEFFVAHGPEGVRDLKRAAQDSKLFLDLKLHDIPNTVAGAVRAAVRCEADFLTLHASGGREMMRAAAEAAKDEEKKTGYAAPLLLGVTVLTSMDARALAETGQGEDTRAQVLRLARLAQDAGLSGLVCSPHEVAMLKEEVPGMTLVVPGVRPAGADIGDQKRVMTPKEAAAAGADWIVVGRPVSGAQDALGAAREIVAALAA